MTMVFINVTSVSQENQFELMRTLPEEIDECLDSLLRQVGERGSHVAEQRPRQQLLPLLRQPQVRLGRLRELQSRRYKLYYSNFDTEPCSTVGLVLYEDRTEKVLKRLNVYGDNLRFPECALCNLK